VANAAAASHSQRLSYVPCVFTLTLFLKLMLFLTLIQSLDRYFKFSGEELLQLLPQQEHPTAAKHDFCTFEHESCIW